MKGLDGSTGIVLDAEMQGRWTSHYLTVPLAAMTQEAYDLFGRAMYEQHARNEARHIRTRVQEARKSPHSANFRWPFELLQNALDSGPRDGGSISIGIQNRDSKLIFQHDSAPFESKDLAALLSGGSNKEFESEKTTGRFGTGFLVTHVLSERTKLRGLLKVSSGYEVFEVLLDRGGDEEAILENTKSCNEAIRLAKPVSDFADLPSASFEYSVGDDQTLLVGLDALRQSLPYLFVSQRALGQIKLTYESGTEEIWTPNKIEKSVFAESFIEQRKISVACNDGSRQREVVAYRFTSTNNDDASALVVVEQVDGARRVLLPNLNAPKIYRDYPLRGSGFVPINFILDGKFDPDQERQRLLMNERDKMLLGAAFKAAVDATTFAFHEGWENAHLLAYADEPPSTFDPADTEERKWWLGQLSQFAGNLAELPIVESASGSFAAINPTGPSADFVIPKLLAESSMDETTIGKLWPLVKASTNLLPPREDLALDWTKNAEGWHRLGVNIERITASALAEDVRQEASYLKELQIETDPTVWLAGFLDVVGECWDRRSGIDLSVLAHLLPDQTGRLRSPPDLHRDGGISDELKDICEAIGLNVRSNLLHSDLEQRIIALGLNYAVGALKQAMPNSLSEADTIQSAIKHLEQTFIEDEECEDITTSKQLAAARLIHYLWTSQGADGAAIARKVPLIASNRRAVRWSHERMMMAPPMNWHESARPFVNAYPPQRVLADFYAGESAIALPNIITALVEFGMAIADPITIDTPAELKGARLSALSLSNADADGATVSGVDFTQIALLQPDVFNRCQEGVEEARALLGLVLCHVAPRDLTWEQERTVKARKAREDIQLCVGGALWLADLKSRTWVPVPSDDGKLTKMRADATTLQHLLDPAWLDDNDSAIRLLSQSFGFDELELRLLGLAPDSEKRRELRGGLAKLIETGGPDPEFYVSLAMQVEEKQREARDIARFQRIGYAVQEAIEYALKAHDLHVKLVDKGFDYAVAQQTDGVLDDIGFSLAVSSYLLEIKATTTGHARMTSTQAAMAASYPSRYVLCVVDLRELSEEELDADWTASKAETLARVITDIGVKVTDTHQLVESAKANSVGIRNESALRYEVPPTIWESGISIGAWVSLISKE